MLTLLLTGEHWYCRERLTGVRLRTSRREADMGVLREMERRSSWLSALGRLPYMEGRKKLALMLGRPIASHRLRSSCESAGPSDHVPPIIENCQCSQLHSGANAGPSHWFLLLHRQSCTCKRAASGCMHAQQSAASQRAQPCRGSHGSALLRLGLPGMEGKVE